MKKGDKEATRGFNLSNGVCFITISKFNLSVLVFGECWLIWTVFSFGSDFGKTTCVFSSVKLASKTQSKKTKCLISDHNHSQSYDWTQ